ncbi:receptor kinase-like protein Xa21 [Argentina anserina]|uniref:receptor kinase-like protein Xa21 n=1 Tax=Argentina anserina TaxID=57926 RepID=UPI002176617A|nr:receptor kinase-like protein Xa21 [Potentilla anserina]
MTTSRSLNPSVAWNDGAPLQASGCLEEANGGEAQCGELEALDMESLQRWGVCTDCKTFTQWWNTLQLISLLSSSQDSSSWIGRKQTTRTITSLVNLHKLERFSVAFNRLGSKGRIGQDLSFLCDLTNATSLYILQLQVNSFGEILPQCTTNLSSSLNYFYVPVNKIHGSVPYGFGNLAKLESLWLSENQFSGIIPSDVGKLPNLYELYMKMSLYSGNIPASIGNLSRLTELYLEENRLEGNPEQDATSLAAMKLARQPEAPAFSSAVQSPSPATSLWFIIFISGFGFISKSINWFCAKGSRQFNKSGVLDVSENMLFGEIPGTLGSCVKLEYLNMQGNFLRGPIPSSLASLRGIQELYLSRNNLANRYNSRVSGAFCISAALNLSYNNLEGMTPSEGVFKNATGTSLKGNMKLCGSIPDFQLPPCKIQHPKR